MTKKARTESSTKLYNYWRSSSSWRVRIGLALKDITDYDYEVINLIEDGGAQYSPSYTALNPSQRVPTLKIDNHVLTQSIAILEYLDETRPDINPFFPKEPIDRASVREICAMIACDIQPVQNLGVLKRVMALVEDENEEKEKMKKTSVKMAWGKDTITRGFEAVEAKMILTAKTYCVGDAISMADILLVPQVYNANRFKVDLDAFPTIKRVAKNLASHPAFESTHPSKMLDAVQ